MRDDDTTKPHWYDWDWVTAEGPAMLRALREASGLSQLEVATRLGDADLRLDQSHLHKIESGRISRPAAKTIDAILTLGLQAPYRLRKDVLEAYGYRLPLALPTKQEVEAGRRLCVQELTTAIWPAYAKDFADRIWGWNRYFPRLIGNTAEDPANDRYVGFTVADILFNPGIGTFRQIANAGEFGTRFLAGFKMVTRAYEHDAWFREFLARANTWPGFREMWDQTPEGSAVIVEEQPIIPIEVQVPGLASPLRFRPVIVNLTLDPRFQVVHVVPFNMETMAICASWAAEAPEG